jgi:hypothetical protein
MVLSVDQDPFALMSNTDRKALPVPALQGARGGLLLVLPVLLLLSRSERCGALANA